MDKIKKTITNTVEEVEKLELMPRKVAGATGEDGECKVVQPLWKTVWQFLKELTQVYCMT